MASPAVLEVMQRAGIGAGSDNGIVGKLTALAEELVGELGFDFHLVDAGLDEAADAAEAVFGDRASAADQRKFEFGFNDTKFVHEPGQALVVMQGIKPLDFLDETGVASFDDDVGAFMLVRVEIDMLALAHEAVKDGPELREPFDAGNAGNGAGLV